MCVCICETQNIENALNPFILRMGDCELFSFVQLGMVHVHSDPIFCTEGADFVQKPFCFVHLVIDFVHLQLCTVGSLLCTLGLPNCTIALTIRTLGLSSCTNGVIRNDGL